MWQFALHRGPDHDPVFFAFVGRKEANVSRRLMKEIASRAAAVPPSAEIRPPQVPISWGELIDKITILEIKCDKLEKEDALGNVRHELSLLQIVARPVLANHIELAALKSQLASTNKKLWQIEDSIREKEARQEFDAEFVTLARSVYKLNDERSAVKKTINERLGSTIIEEKSYSSRATVRAP
jgi:hypothetical protein